MRRYLAIVSSLVVTASVASAAPGKRHHRADATTVARSSKPTKATTKPAKKPAKVAAKHAAKHAKVVRETDDVAVDAADAAEVVDADRIELDGDGDDAPVAPRHPHAHAHARAKVVPVAKIAPSADTSDDLEPPGETPVVSRETVEVVDDESADTLGGAPGSLTERVDRPHGHDWHVAIGPYLWASSVDAKVNVGGSNISSGIGFAQLEKHAKFGVPLLLDAGYKRFALTVDMQYGVIGIDGSQPVGPLMVSLNGAAADLSADALAGYRVVGDRDSLLQVEARGGIRYERTQVAATLGVQGMTVTGASLTDVSAEAVAGGRVFVRPWRHVYFSGQADIGLVGTSSTWSAETDAMLSIGSHVLLSLGYRTLNSSGGAVDLTEHGPRGALQVQF
jgi:hypothetical protein|nr:hypothetical protein [Kofleriaceae bacterium]